MSKSFVVLMTLLGMISAGLNFGPGPAVFFVDVPVSDPEVQNLVIEGTKQFNNQINSAYLYVAKTILKAEKQEPIGVAYRIEVLFAKTSCFKGQKARIDCQYVDGSTLPKARIETIGDSKNLVSLTVTPIG
uniref:Cystatin domain-containing protein n=1 Tax=Panagrellus redivivus TaxID=6233 RepID=A0A7E4W560_PANRE